MTFLIVLAALFMALLACAALGSGVSRLPSEPWDSPNYIRPLGARAEGRTAPRFCPDRVPARSPALPASVHCPLPTRWQGSTNESGVSGGSRWHNGRGTHRFRASLRDQPARSAGEGDQPAARTARSFVDGSGLAETDDGVAAPGTACR